MNQNETKLDLVNPMSPNQIIKSEIITGNYNSNENSENNTNQDFNNQTLENNVNQDVQPNEQKPKKKFNWLLIIIVLVIVIAVGGIALFFMQNR